MKVYFDNAATTNIAKEVLCAMNNALKNVFGNAASLHDFGRKAFNELEKAREIIAESINAKPEEIIFTSGGTESNNLALKGVFFADPEKRHFITSKIEHDSILEACEWLEMQGAKITYISVDKHGFVNLEKLEKAIRKNTALVSIMHVNNEIGTIEPIEKIGRICKKHGVLFHTDACQSYTKIPIDVKKQNIDLITLNAHKIHGPKGVGALYIRKNTTITPLFHGGGQERKLRSGTVNVPGIIGFAKAVEIVKEKHIRYTRQLRDVLIKKVLSKIPEAKLNGPNGQKRICNNANFSFRHLESETILFHLGVKGIAVSTGSACASKSTEPSHVLKAIGVSRDEALGSIRISLSRYNTLAEVKYFVKILSAIIKNLKRSSPFY